MTTETIDELKEVLKKRYGFDGRELRNKDEKWLLETLQNEENKVEKSQEIDFGSLEIVDDEPIVEDEIKQALSNSPPTPGSEGWHEHVMKMFFSCEVTDGHPNVEGLRRVAQLQIGTIVENVCAVVQAPNPTNCFTATAFCRMTVNLHNPVNNIFSVVFQDIADASSRNTPAPFNLHVSSTASSRAEARVLRKILQLNKIIAAEEVVPEGALADSVREDEEFGGPQFITDQQITLVDLLCERLDINPMKYLNSGKRQYKEIGDMPRKTAAEAIEHLHNYEKEKAPIPNAVKGYNPEWQTLN